MSIPVVNSSELLRDWLEGRSQEDLQVFCEDPEEIKSTSVFSKSYLTYRIIMRSRLAGPMVQIRHRYSEFEALRSEMVNRYATCGVLIPLLPPKKPVSSLIQGKQDSLFVKERTIGLSLFCEAIVQNPYLRYDVAWEEFLGGLSFLILRLPIYLLIPSQEIRRQPQQNLGHQVSIKEKAIYIQRLSY